MRNIILRCFFLFLLILSPHASGATSTSEQKLVYNVLWIGLKAGTATLSLDNTPEGITITTRAISAPFISVFYRVDDFAQSTLHPNGYPNKYTLKIQEGTHRRGRVVFFGIKPENEPQKIVYINNLNNETVEFYSERQAFDPLSAGYELSKRHLEIGHSEYMDIFDSKKLYNTEVQVLRRERITVPAGEFDTIVVKPLLQSEGIFMRKGEIYIWLTDDERKIPVMIKSKVKIGSIVVELVEGAY